MGIVDVNGLGQWKRRAMLSIPQIVVVATSASSRPTAIGTKAGRGDYRDWRLVKPDPVAGRRIGTMQCHGDHSGKPKVSQGI